MLLSGKEVIPVPAICDNLKQLRTARGLTQAEVAQRLGVTRQTISSYESGRTMPDLETLKRLTDILGCDLEQLLYGQSPAQRRQKRARRAAWIVLGAIGANAELYFVDEQLGFLLLPNADSRYSRLYRTGDGGVSFELVELNAGDEDLDAPSLPTLEDGRLRLEVGGGTDGSGDTVVLYSDDLGVTWSQG